MLCNESGQVLAEGAAEYGVQMPAPGWTEQDPSDWITAADKAVRAIGEHRPDAIGLTGQMHGSVFLDEAGRVIRPALLWNDQRTSAECEELAAQIGLGRLMEITGNPPLTGFQLPKILWLRRREPENCSRLRHVLLPKDYLRLAMCGVYATDASDASGVGLLDLRRRQWSEPLIEELRLDRGWFPDVHEPTAVTSVTKGGFGGLEDGIPIAAGAGDQSAGAIGAGIATPGPVSISLGTSGVVFTCLSAAKYDPTGGCHTFCHAGGGWHAMGVVLSCGGAIRWARDVLTPGAGFGEFDALAAQAEPGSAGVTFKPYLAGERSPTPDATLRGSWQGLSLASGRPEMARSALEGATFALKQCFDVLQTLGARADRIRVTGGGAASRLWVQMIADVFGVPAVTLKAAQGPAVGAALIAGVAVGVFGSTSAAASVVQESTEVTPGRYDYTEAFTRFADDSSSHRKS